MANLENLYINNLYLKGDRRELQTFRLIPNYDRIDRFVSSEMSKIPDDERILRRDNPISFWSFRKHNDVVFDCEAYSLKKESIDHKEDYLAHFADVLTTGEDSWFEPEDIRLRYRTDDDLFSFRIGYLPYSIQTTENLYKLGLLENRRFDSGSLQFGDLSEVAELFSLSDMLHSTDLDDLDKLIAYGIVPEDKERHFDYYNSSKVYKNLRQHYK